MDEHREEVVERLLYRGLSPTALVALLPDWELLVGDAADQEHCRPTDAPTPETAA